MFVSHLCTRVDPVCYVHTRGMAEFKLGAMSWSAEIPAPRKQNTNGSVIWSEKRRFSLGVKRKVANIVTSKTPNTNMMTIKPGSGCCNILQTCVTKTLGSEPLGQAPQT